MPSVKRELAGAGGMLLLRPELPPPIAGGLTAAGVASRFEDPEPPAKRELAAAGIAPEPEPPKPPVDSLVLVAAGVAPRPELLLLREAIALSISWNSRKLFTVDKDSLSNAGVAPRPELPPPKAEALAAASIASKFEPLTPGSGPVAAGSLLANSGAAL